MNIYPAIDIKGGMCVRLKMGDMARATEYGDPAEMALKWQSLGAKFLHIVDLDAAFSGTFSNCGAVSNILRAVSIPVQLGGGVRTMADIDVRLGELGIWRVIIGTAAYDHPELVEQACAKYPGRIVLGLDAKDGSVATKGWAENTGADAVELALDMKARGITTAVYTDISKDGMLTGPNLAGIKDIVIKTGLDVIASGGMSCMDDVKRVSETGAEGVIIGKALYTGAIDLSEAIELGAKAC
jgi:phosphoribosylformimino-5-aminoimidazole carboxamide ribotide isomerase